MARAHRLCAECVVFTFLLAACGEREGDTGAVLRTPDEAAAVEAAGRTVVRFLQGFFESSLYSGTIYILGSWYKPLEIAKRTAIFTAIGQIGSMFAGVMMTAMNEGLHGQTALEGWRWVFIISRSALLHLITQLTTVQTVPWASLSASLV